jgi:hypothetical protein
MNLLMAALTYNVVEYCQQEKRSFEQGVVTGMLDALKQKPDD